MKQLFLPKHVYFCGDEETIVFLDLRNNRYMRIDGAQAAAVGSLADDPVPSRVPSPELDEIVELSLLTSDGSIGKAVVATEVHYVTERLIHSRASHDGPLRLRDVWRFFISCMTAWAKLRLQKIEKIVATIELRKQRSAHLASLRLDEARRLVAIFNRLRSLFPADYICLLDSLALVEFLARYDVFPTLVFGIRLEPWAAHCWVQERRLVFNDEVEAVSQYVPIMAV